MVLSVVIAGQDGFGVVKRFIMGAPLVFYGGEVANGMYVLSFIKM